MKKTITNKLRKMGFSVRIGEQGVIEIPLGLKIGDLLVLEATSADVTQELIGTEKTPRIKKTIFAKISVTRRARKRDLKRHQVNS